ncbi:MAG: hypothetical protein AMXMBFR61_19460 [Fimbriimonadales bacterium]
MSRERYEQFLRSPIGRWLESLVPPSAAQPASAAVGRFVALLAADIASRVAANEPAEDARELLDLVMYRLYGFSPREVEIVEEYLHAGGADEAVAESLGVVGFPETLAGSTSVAVPPRAEYNECPVGS